MKKLLSITLILAMVLTLGVTAFASDSRNWQEGFGFHCNNASGNGATSVEYTGDNSTIIRSIERIKKQPAGSMVVQKGDQKDIFGTKAFPIPLERVDDTTTWNLLTEDINCETCGRNDWVTYSNNNGVINGKNIQANHPPIIEDPGADFSGNLTLEKTIGGLSVMAWADSAGLTEEEIIAIFEDISFNIYKVASKDDAIASEDLIQNTKFFDLGLDGQGFISFSALDSSLLPGWFAVEEIIGEEAAKYFEEAAIQYFYFDEFENVVGGETGSRSIVSGVDGKISTTEPMLVNDPTDEGNYITNNLLDLWKSTMNHNFGDAKFIWNANDTYVYGIDGSTITVDITVDVPSKVTSAWLDIACDNAAVVYVNGKLAGYTASLVSKPADNEDNFDSFHTLLFGEFDGTAPAWSQVREIDFADFLIEGENIITIYAANSASTGEYIDGDFVPGKTGTPNDDHDLLNNPCGLIFNGEISFEGNPTTFDNIPKKLDDEFSSEVSFLKTKYDGLLEVEAGEFEFELFKIATDGKKTLVGTYQTDDNGVVTAPIKEPGSYVFTEVLAVDYSHNLGASIEQDWSYRLVWNAIYPEGDDGLFFEVNGDGLVTWEAENPVVNNVYYCKHNMLWTVNRESDGSYEWKAGGVSGFIKPGVCGADYHGELKNANHCEWNPGIYFSCPEEVHNVWDTTIGTAPGHDLNITHRLAGCTDDESYSFTCKNCYLAENHKDRPDLLKFVPDFDYESYNPDLGLAKALGHNLDLVDGNRRAGMVSADGTYSAELWCRHNAQGSQVDCSVSGYGGWARHNFKQLECGEEYIIARQNAEPPNMGTWKCGTCEVCNALF